MTPVIEDMLAALASDNEAAASDVEKYILALEARVEEAERDGGAGQYAVELQRLIEALAMRAPFRPPDKAPHHHGLALGVRDIITTAEARALAAEARAERLEEAAKERDCGAHVFEDDEATVCKCRLRVRFRKNGPALAPEPGGVCEICDGTGELREAVQAWDVPGAPVPECPHCAAPEPAVEAIVIAPWPSALDECGFVCRCGMKNSSHGDGTCIDACNLPKGHTGKHNHYGHDLRETPAVEAPIHMPAVADGFVPAGDLLPGGLLYSAPPPMACSSPSERGPCELQDGHDGLHVAGKWNWRDVPPPPVSEALCVVCLEPLAKGVCPHQSEHDVFGAPVSEAKADEVTGVGGIPARLIKERKREKEAAKSLPTAVAGWTDAIAEADSLRSALEKVKAERDESLRHQAITWRTLACVYCDWTEFHEEGALLRKDRLAAHSRVCPKHPIRARLESLKAVAGEMQGALKALHESPHEEDDVMHYASCRRCLAGEGLDAYASWLKEEGNG